MAFSARTGRWGILAVSAVVFLLGTLFVARHSDIFISPDETATQFFTQAFSLTGSFRVLDRVNGTFGGILHPRSIVTDGMYLLPGGFLGLPVVLAFFAFFFGGWIVPFLTPMIAILAALAWGKLLQCWFSKRIAFVSALLLLFHPAVWYYASRGLMPNVLFVSFLIFGAYFLCDRPLVAHLKRCANRIGTLKYFQTHVDIALAGCCFGFALFVRVVELYWVFPLIVLLLVVSRTRRVRDIVVFTVAFALPLVLMLFLNTQTYGNPFVMGYNFVSSSQSPIATAVQQEVATDRLSWIFPFGLHLRATAKHVAYYLFALFWWLSALTVIGLPVMLKSTKGKRTQRIFILTAALLALWLGFWYGSWTLFDNPDPKAITIANSYVRYWMPLFALSTPFIASALVWISERGRTRIAKFFLLVLLLVGVIGMNIRTVFFQGPDALIHVDQILNDSKIIRARVFDLTSSDSVIVVDRADKLFFPFRHVIYPLRSESMYAALPTLVSQVPLYYYGVTLPQTDLDYLNQLKFASNGLHIDFIETFGVESLYRITRP